MGAPQLNSTLSPGVLLAGKYRIEKLIGRGGMGAVYVAHHLALDQRVAVKVLAPEMTSAGARFVREARAAARLQSEHIARVMDVGAADGIGPYMVMEYLVGCDLGQLLEKNGRFPVEEAVDAVLEAIDALAEAHSNGIVHRDLKPSNLFLAVRAGQSATVKVLDFGISKMTELDAAAQKLTETRAVIGSPHYMSPEQLRSARDVDARADIWSMGVVLYELLTGAMPFEGHTVGAVFANVLERAAPSPRALRPDLHAELNTAILRCLRRDPAERFQHIGELALALAPFGSGRAAAAVERASAFTTLQLRGSSSAVLALGGAATSRTQLDSAGTGRSEGWGRGKPRRWRRLTLAVVGVSVLVAVAAGAVLFAARLRHAPHPPPIGSTLPSLASDSADLAARSPPPITADPSAVPTVPSIPAASSVPAVASAAHSSSPLPPPSAAALAVRPHASPHLAVAPSSAPPAPSAGPDLDRRR